MWEMHQNAHNSKIFLTIYIGPRWPAVHLSYYLVSMFNYALFEFESFFNYVILTSKNLLAFSFLNDIAELPPSFQKRKQKANMSRRRSGMRTCRTFGGGRKGKILQWHDQKMESQENFSRANSLGATKICIASLSATKFCKIPSKFLSLVWQFS